MQTRLARNLFCLLDGHGSTSPCTLAEHAGVLPFIYEIAPEAAHRRAYEANLAQDAAQCTELEELRALFAAEEIPAIPLKGCVLKPIYPGGSHMRSMCDLDILCHEEDAVRIRDLLLARGYRADMFQEYHHDEYSLEPLLHIEMHRALTPETERAGAYYAAHDPWERATRAADGTWDLPLEDHYLFIVAHFASHLLERGGSSLRGLVDMYVFRAHYQNLDDDYLRSALEEMGLLDFEEKYLRMAHDLFNGEEPQTKAWERELALMLRSGMSGTAEIRAQRRREEIGGSRAHYIRVRLFPPYVHMQELYPKLKRHKWLLPFFYVRRMVIAPFRHHTALKAELTELRGGKSGGGVRFDWRTAVTLVLMLAVMVTIFCLSHQDGSTSYGVSNSVADSMGIETDGELPPDKVPILFGFSLRKLAHIGIFAILGGTAALFYLSLLRPRRGYYIIAGLSAFVTSVLYAISDEIHQIFIPNRYGKMIDVLIDSIGIVIAVPATCAICYGLTKLVQKCRKGKNVLDKDT